VEPFVAANVGTFGPLVETIPDPLRDMQQQIAFKVGIAAKQAETQQAQAEAAQTVQKVGRAQLFQQDLQAVQANPSPTAVSSLMMKYPEFADQVKSGWDLKDKAQRDTDLTHIGQVYAPALAGNWEVAKKAAHERYDADKAGGLADADDDQFISQIDAAAGGDKQAQKFVLTHLGLQAAAAAGPDHFASVYGALSNDYTLDEGAARFENGEMVAHSPFIKDANGNIRLWNDDGTAPAADALPSDTAAPPAKGGFENAVETVLSNEGGYNARDLNGAPVNFGINQKANPDLDVKGLTREQAKQIYLDRYWKPSGAEDLPANLQTPYFDAYIRNPKMAKAALVKSGGDPERFVQLTSAYFQNLAAKPGNGKYAKAWANRDANNLAIATGQAEPAAAAPARAAADASTERFPIAIPGKAPTQFKVLTPAEAKSQGLDPSATWKMNTATNEVTKLADAADEGLDDATTTFYAQQMLTGGQMPALGMGKAAARARQEIMKKVAQLAGAEGLTGKDLAVQIAHYKAGVGNVQNLEKIYGSVQANEQNALANGKQFLDRSQELTSGKSRFRLLNRVQQSALRHTGDPTIAAMDAAAITFANEYAKVMTGTPSGGGTLSDSARDEAQSIMKGDFPVEQKLSTYRQMVADMNNRMSALQNSISEGYKNVGVNSSASLPKGAKVIGTYQGKRVIQLPNGKRMVEQ
jgi:hypothetical protein